MGASDLGLLPKTGGLPIHEEIYQNKSVGCHEPFVCSPSNMYQIVPVCLVGKCIQGSLIANKINKEKLRRLQASNRLKIRKSTSGPIGNVDVAKRNIRSINKLSRGKRLNRFSEGSENRQQKLYSNCNSSIDIKGVASDVFTCRVNGEEARQASNFFWFSKAFKGDTFTDLFL